MNSDQTDWDEWLTYAMFTYKTTPHSATGFTPFELTYGHQAILTYGHQVILPIALSHKAAKTNVFLRRLRAGITRETTRY